MSPGLTRELILLFGGGVVIWAAPGDIFGQWCRGLYLPSTFRVELCVVSPCRVPFAADAGQLQHELGSKAHEADALQARLASTESDDTELRKAMGELQARFEDLEQENSGLQAQVRGDEYPCSSAARCVDDHWCCRRRSVQSRSTINQSWDTKSTLDNEGHGGIMRGNEAICWILMVLLWFLDEWK